MYPSGVRREQVGDSAVTAATEQNKAIVRRFFDAWNSRQPDVFDGLMASNGCPALRSHAGCRGSEVLIRSRNFCGKILGLSLILSKPSNF